MRGRTAWVIGLGMCAAAALGSVSGDARACVRHGCDGVSPEGSGCMVDKFVACTSAIRTSDGNKIGHVDLVYSHECDTAWTYTEGGVAGDMYLDVYAYIQRYTISPYAKDGHYEKHASFTNFVRSPMMYDPTSTFCYGYGYVGTDEYHAKTCDF